MANTPKLITNRYYNVEGFPALDISAPHPCVLAALERDESEGELALGLLPEIELADGPAVRVVKAPNGKTAAVYVWSSADEMWVHDSDLEIFRRMLRNIVTANLEVAKAWELDRKAALIAARLDSPEDTAEDGSHRLDGGIKTAHANAAKLGRKLAALDKTARIRSLAEMVLVVHGDAFAIDADAFDARADLLPVANGVVDLRTGERIENDPAFFFTKRCAVEYDPEATAPRWEAFLGEVFPDDAAMPGYLQELIGYAISGETSDQAFYLLVGGGANGKGTFLDPLTQVFGSITATTPFETFEEINGKTASNDLAALRGVRLVRASEGNQGAPMAEASLKRITGQDKIAARFLYSEFQEFTPRFAIFLDTNHRPRFRGQDEGLWRRVRLIEFKRTFRPEERDHKLRQTLRDERAGILAWAVRGAVRFFAKDTGQVQPTPSMLAAQADYRASMDALGGFYPGVITQAPGTVLHTAVVEAYFNWLDAEDPGAKPMTARGLAEALRARGLHGRKTNKGLAWDGIALTSTSAGPGMSVFAGQDTEVTEVTQSQKFY